ncbi:PQQ-dependent sugar dehydrogenase, partial [Stenotrophomonas sp. 3diitr2024]|uniref:PQQ-dependent sugar dehydrogenase n=1 Tax=Stenotrophomonas sp. 3diitr2024 TaxID=3345115 RepID=UPI0035CB9DF5
MALLVWQDDLNIGIDVIDQQHRRIIDGERGVRVRILLDDMNAKDKDALMMALDRHPNIEIRLYNPFASQGGVAAQVWSLGHRNILGMAFDANGKLWAHEMGP